MNGENKFIVGGDDATKDITKIESSRDDSISDKEKSNNLPKNISNKNFQHQMGSKVLQHMGVPKKLSDIAAKNPSKISGLPTMPGLGNISERKKSEENNNENNEQSKKGDFKGNLKGGLKNNLLENTGNETIDKAIKTAKKVKFIWGILPTILPIFAVIVAVTCVVMAPMLFAETLKIKERIHNLFVFNTFKTDEQRIESFHKEVDSVIEKEKNKTNVELDKELLVAGLYYGSVSLDHYVETLSSCENLEGCIETLDVDYERLRNYAYAVSLQMIHTTVVVHNDTYIVTTVDKDGNEHNTEYCYGTQISKQKYNKYSEESDTFSDIRDPEGSSKICAYISYSLDKEKFGKFLKYIYVPQEIYGEKLVASETIWKNIIALISTGSEEKKERIHYLIKSSNIGTKYDNYSKLTLDEQQEVDSIVSMILSLASTQTKLVDKYYIKGAVSLPVDISPTKSIKDRISSPYGYRIHPISGLYKMHNGIDINYITTSDPLYSIADGVVIASRMGTSYGNYVTIGHDNNDDGKYDFYSRYAHLRERHVSEGDIVRNGQVIGIMGTTGSSTGIHLHFELLDENEKSMDPLPYLIEIENNSSSLATNTVSSITQAKADEMENELLSSIENIRSTRNAAVITAKYLVDNLTGLPYFCGGYTTKVIDISWYKLKQVSDNTCPNYSYNVSYGLGVNGFINWVLGTSGFDKVNYSIDELANLGKKTTFLDPKIKAGDLTWKEGNIGIILEITNEKVAIAYMSVNKGLTVETYKRGYIGNFTHVIRMDDFYII